MKVVIVVPRKREDRFIFANTTNSQPLAMKFNINKSETQLINFLQKELAISDSFIVLALRDREQDPAPLPMLLWQYGLISLKQLEQIFDWLER